MPISRATPVGALAERVADHDLVLTPDPPLAAALTRRVDRPRFGTVATTPRRLAAGRRETTEDRTAFLAAVERTDHDWTALSYAVGNVLQCWEHQGELEAILEYEAYADDVTRDVVEVLGNVQTTPGALAEYTVGEGRNGGRGTTDEQAAARDVARDALTEDGSLAVVGEAQFTPLERSILPDEYTSVSLFTDETVPPPTVHVFDTATALVEAVVDAVDAESAADVAVVLDSGSRYATLVEAGLAAADVPFYGGPGFADRRDVRSFLALCRTAFRGDATTVGDVRGVLATLGADVPVTHDAKRLAAVEHPGARWVGEFAAALPERTFGDALYAYAERLGASLPDLRAELDSLDILDRTVDADGVDALAHYLATYEVPIDRENEGVLLADATAAGHVDRPAVFLVGLDDGWTHTPPRRPWVDAAETFDRHLREFQRLLQSGIAQYALVQDSAGGEPVTPCPYFQELLDESIERFDDLPATAHSRLARPDVGSGFDREPVGVAPDPPDAFSNSRLSSYVNSPRDHCFSELLEGPDRDYFTEGTWYHDFAECYAEHPATFDADAIETVVDLMVADVTAFVTETEVPLRRRAYRIGLETIATFLDERWHDADRADDHFVVGSSFWGDNAVADHFGLALDSPATERWFSDDDPGVNGVIDLVFGPDHLLDYKSGSKSSRRDVVRRADVDAIDDRADFQAALYLSHLRRERPGEPLQFTFFHFLEDLGAQAAGRRSAADRLEDCLTTVAYYPRSFDDHVASRTAFDVLLGGYNDCVATFEALGFDRYAEIVSSLTFPETTEKSELQDSAFAASFTAAVEAATGDDVDAEKGCEQAVRLLNGHRSRAFFAPDVDAVETFVADHLEQLAAYHRGEERFPVEGPGGEPNYRRIDHRDLILSERGEDTTAGEHGSTPEGER